MDKWVAAAKTRVDFEYARLAVAGNDHLEIEGSEGFSCEGGTNGFGDFLQGGNAFGDAFADLAAAHFDAAMVDGASESLAIKEEVHGVFGAANEFLNHVLVGIESECAESIKAWNDVETNRGTAGDRFCDERKLPGGRFSEDVAEEATFRSADVVAEEEPVGFEFVAGEGNNLRRRDRDARAEGGELLASGGEGGEFGIDGGDEEGDFVLLAEVEERGDEIGIVAARDGEAAVGALARGTPGGAEVGGQNGEIAI